mmetsp:Transcript_4339/g.8336  ORF Transcript_4339/g.8336 Transcript_4339/m.8336 type:complete len:142 (+) Transcript_4339:19-444(+)
MKKRGSFYRVMDGQRYDRGMLEAAETAAKKHAEGVIKVAGAQEILKEALDGGKYTKTERKTMKYIQTRYSLSKKAKRVLKRELKKFKDKMKERREKEKEESDDSVLGQLRRTKGALKKSLEEMSIKIDVLFKVLEDKIESA